MSKCGRPPCNVPANSSCSSCGREQYCSSSCQKLDWKKHKSMCPILKRLSNKLQPFSEVVRIIDEIRSIENFTVNDVRVLEHLLSYAEHQFGQEIPLTGYRERDGQCIGNWEVTEYFHAINKDFVLNYAKDISISCIDRDNAMLPYLKRSLSLLNPFLIYLNSKDILNEDQKNVLLQQLFSTELNISVAYSNKNQFDVAEGHSQRCLDYAKRFGVEGPNKTTFIFSALRGYCRLRECKGDYPGAIILAEECYNLVVEAYDPVHPQVQEAAGVLIGILISKGDLFDAERYARITYSNLRDSKNGMDQESEGVAMGTFNLALVIFHQGEDFIEAEKLARESLRIRTLIWGRDHSNVGTVGNLLAKILMEQKKFGDETWVLLKHSLDISIRNEGPDGSNVAYGNSNMGTFYYSVGAVDGSREKYKLAKFHYGETVRIYTKIYGPNNPNTIYAYKQWSILK